MKEANNRIYFLTQFRSHRCTFTLVVIELRQKFVCQKFNKKFELNSGFLKLNCNASAPSKSNQFFIDMISFRNLQLIEFQSFYFDISLLHFVGVVKSHENFECFLIKGNKNSFQRFQFKFLALVMSVDYSYF